MSTRSRVLLSLAAVSIAAVACSDASRPALTAPDRIDSQSQNLVGTLTGLLVAPVTRNTPLANDVVWSFYAGPEGATTVNSKVGVTVVIPKGALSSNVKITVTAVKGSAVAYAFSPHLEFGKKVYITQNLNGTSAGLLSGLALNGAHFPGDRPQYTSNGLAIVDEVVPAVVQSVLGGLLGTLTRTATFGVDHFTGWLVASGMD